MLTAADLPFAEGAAGRAGQPLAREEVVYAGQPVALVVAESEAAATDGVDLVMVDIEPLEAALDLEAAMAPGAPRARIDVAAGDGADVGGAHAAAGGGDEGDDATEDLSDNVAGRQRMVAGDAAAALAGGAAGVAGRFSTSWIHQGYLEPQVATAWLEPEGGLVISSSTQGAFSTRQQLADLLGWSHDRVRVRPAPLGGAFGGKLMICEPLAAAAAVKLGRPVRLALTRMEDFAASNPAPGELIDLEAGATRRRRAHRGPRADRARSRQQRRVRLRGARRAAGVRPLPLAGARHRLLRRAHQPRRLRRLPRAVRAAGRLRDRDADRRARRPSSASTRSSCGCATCCARATPASTASPSRSSARPSAWSACARTRCGQRRGELPEGEGVGVALGWWPGGLEPAAASCRLDADGRLTIVTGAVDMSGTETVFQSIAAEAFGLDHEAVRVVAGDTAGSPYAGLSGGSKVIYTVGRAVQRAAEQARERLLEVAATELEIAPEDLELVDGAVRPVGSPDRGVTVAELASKVLQFGSPYAPVEGYGGTAQTSRAPGAAAHLSHVRVDRETGAVTLLHHVIAQDVGRALNPALVAGQLVGGVTQGLGWALFEELAYDETGQLRTGSFVEYAMPTIDTVPPIDAEIVEVPAPDGPFGAKGVGEPPVVGVPAGGGQRDRRRDGRCACATCR